MPKLGQIFKYLTRVKIGEGWLKCLGQNEALSASLNVEVLDFRQLPPFKPQSVKADWSWKARPNFSHLTPVKNKKFRYRGKHISSVVLSWYTLWHFWWENLLMVNQPLLPLLATKATEFGEIRQNNGHYAVQSHSRSPILVPIESQYTTSYLWLILTYLLSCTISKLWLIICQMFARDRGSLHFNAVDAGWFPANIATQWTIKKRDILFLTITLASLNRFL